MSENKIEPADFLSSLFLYAHDFNFNHIVFDVTRYKISVSLSRRSARYGNTDMFYTSADAKVFARVMSVINHAIELAELEGSQQATIMTPNLKRESQIFQFKLHEFGAGKYQLDLSI
ncbi:hypothetical protein [Convivina praedatoris]|uniref:Uncharacterized protein n=1 Tax=Convivina praedatoris TaxID=2880963 RepID=A0ABM9D148_9LACO|nr:hypothetical protein [Convivina sp. LMG 32447]CAH1852725.1 hypothetical protein LMG032447_00646 [Convivina sp. LMG 32447]CAH1852759.1 hypothetical protein R078138_00656 [Convivina sp. LMG 32447]CAH1854802.1 hypothetical protein R077815_01085 [Convivina sp. LMG 32447]